MQILFRITKTLIIEKGNYKEAGKDIINIRLIFPWIYKYLKPGSTTAKSLANTQYHKRDFAEKSNHIYTQLH
jgi:hypothetical protein